MQTFKLAPFVAAFTVALAACGASPSSPPASSTRSAPAIDGRWTSACAPSPQADGSTQYLVLDFTIGKSDWKIDYVVHGDAACSVKLLTVTIDGDYALDRPSPSVAGAWEARFGFAHKVMTPHVDGLVQALTGAKCGAKPWKIGEGQDVYDAGCAAFGQYPKATCPADFDLVKLDAGALHFGDRPKDNDMCTPAKRPSAISSLALPKRG